MSYFDFVPNTNIFRYFQMGHEELFNRISNEISTTNMFVGFRIDPNESMHNDLLPKPELTNDWSNSPRVKFTIFQITHPKEEFLCSEDSVKKPPKQPAEVTGHDSYTPSAMEMCTPYVNRCDRSKQDSRQRSISGSSFNSDLMVETPILKSNIVDEIKAKFQKLEVTEPKVWYYYHSPLKGFRDPQIQNEED